MLAADVETGLALGEEGIYQCALNAIGAAFLEQGEREALRDRFEAAWTSWQSTSNERV